MEYLRIFFYVVIALLAISCGSNSTQTNSNQPIGKESIESAINPEAVDAAHDIVKKEYASDAIFSEDVAIVTATDVVNRYKVQHHFGSVEKEYLDLIFTIWVQKFGDSWEYGNLTITTPKGEVVYISNGRMKELERQEMLRIEDGEVDSIKYTIIEHSAPNFVRISTPQQLSNTDIKKVASELGVTYESIFFCIENKTARGDEYVNVQGVLVFDYRGDGEIKNLEDL